MMRVLHIVPSFYPAIYHGGPIFSLYELCNGLAEQGVELRVLTTDTAGPGKRVKADSFPQLTPAGYPVYFCRRWLFVSVAPGILWHMIGLIRWADVVHLTAVYSFPTIPTLALCRLFNKPVVWSPRGSLLRWEGSTQLGLKAIWERVCRLVSPRKLILHVTSEEEAEQSLTRYPGLKFAVISNSIHIPAGVSPVLQNGALRLLYLGRIDPKKGIENLLAACALLNKNSDLSWWSLTIAGTGDLQYVESIKTLTKKLVLSSRVKMVGEVMGETKQQLYENADVVLLPSYSENFGMVVAEALAHGVPVIASKKTPWQRLEEKGCGLWVDNDPESLAKSITEINGMPLKEMGRRGRRWVQEEFSALQKAKEMVEVYEKLMNGRR